MKKWDLIIIIVLIILSLMPIRFLISNNNVDLKRVIISVNGEEYESLELNENLNKIIKIEEELGINEICINKGQIYMNHSNCTDKVCMRQGKISKIGESIVCLPNRVFIEIKGDEEGKCILSY
ncbi:NusG domain II-containing protein [Clostridium perfringens]|uniref:NusG domain II-containing protein n=1 Tax=Clostridium perfringens TaxID=1502 RepID=UPI001A1D4C71|nr:NusG domain II-containing protein [Clostridium perfringens]MBO3389236.1 NusG domain II-containing protein [Clostridium perfringens]MBO3413022.1 NusG domain II-containing protein [Clostridium perfringens]HAT4252596.1 NusG domain II-containing protein [Clostridium perfringens]HAT4270316.1 NusG domain II-containing protein [Clostridium perfringens]